MHRQEPRQYCLVAYVILSGVSPRLDPGKDLRNWLGD
jgi:hypothetical protein